MKKAEYNSLPLGLYRLHWKSGGHSLAAVGMLPNGDRWMAPVNWVEPPLQHALFWRAVKRAEMLTPNAPLTGAGHKS